MTWPLATDSVVRQYVVGTDLPEQRLLVLMDILGLNPVQRSELVAFLQTEGSLLKSAGLSPALQQLVRDMNEDTWFKLDGTGKVTGTVGGCRPGEPIADLFFVFMFGKVLKEARSVLIETEYGWTVGYDENQFVEARARRHTAQELKRLMQTTVSTSLDMKTRKNCWQLCGSQQRSSARLRRGMGSQSTSVCRRRRRWWFSDELAETR